MFRIFSKVLRRFDHFPRYDILKFEDEVSDAIPAHVHKVSPLLFFHVFVNLTGKEPLTGFSNVHDHFLRSCEVSNHDVSGIILANEHTQYANCGLD